MRLFSKDQERWIRENKDFLSVASIKDIKGRGLSPVFSIRLIIGLALINHLEVRVLREAPSPIDKDFIRFGVQVQETSCFSFIISGLELSETPYKKDFVKSMLVKSLGSYLIPEEILLQFSDIAEVGL